MIAARFHEVGEPLVVEDIPIPSPEPDEVLIDMKAASICGSDISSLSPDNDFQPDRTPLTMGHEGAGVVTEVGDAVKTLSVDDHVVVHYVDSCGNCKHCLVGNDNQCRRRTSIGDDVDGTFAEYLAVPERAAITISDAVPFEWGSIAGCAVSTAYHAISCADLDGAETIVVFGIGGVGRHVVMLANFFATGDVIGVDINEEKLVTADNYGADITLNSSDTDVTGSIQELTNGYGADVAIECSGSDIAFKQAIESVNGNNLFESGTVVSVGLQTEPMEIEYWQLREGNLMVSGDHTRADLRNLLKLLKVGKIDLSESITHHVELENIQDGIDLLREGQENIGRIIVETE